MSLSTFLKCSILKPYSLSLLMATFASPNVIIKLLTEGTKKEACLWLCVTFYFGNLLLAEANLLQGEKVS